MLRRLFALPLAAVLLGISGCDAGPADRAAADERGTDSVAVEDAAGSTVRLDSPAQRIISLIPAVTATLVELGLADRLVARTDYDADPRLADLASVGGGLTPSLEAIAALRPDLVIAWRDARSRTVVSRLEQLGVAVYAARIETIGQSFRTTRAIGRLTGRSQAADSLVAAIRESLDDVRERVAGRERPRVLYVVWNRPPATAGGDTFVHELIRLAGAENVFADLSGWPQVSLEEIVRRDPDVVVIPEAGVTAERLAREPGWRELSAVRAGRVLAVDPELFNQPGPAMARAAEQLARRLHPAAEAGAEADAEADAGALAETGAYRGPEAGAGTGAAADSAR